MTGRCDLHGGRDLAACDHGPLLPRGTSLTIAQATERWPTTPATYMGDTDCWYAVFDGAKAEGFTGIVTGEPVTDSDGKTWHVVFEFEAGEVHDRYLSKAPASA